MCVDIMFFLNLNKVFNQVADEGRAVETEYVLEQAGLSAQALNGSRGSSSNAKIESRAIFSALRTVKVLTTVALPVHSLHLP